MLKQTNNFLQTYDYLSLNSLICEYIFQFHLLVWYTTVFYCVYRSHKHESTSYPIQGIQTWNFATLHPHLLLPLPSVPSLSHLSNQNSCAGKRNFWSQEQEENKRNKKQQTDEQNHLEENIKKITIKQSQSSKKNKQFHTKITKNIQHIVNIKKSKQHVQPRETHNRMKKENKKQSIFVLIKTSHAQKTRS